MSYNYLFVGCRGIYVTSSLAYLNWSLANKGYVRYTLEFAVVKIVNIMWYGDFGW